MWIDEASRIQSAADRREFVNGVVGYQSPGIKGAILAGILAWSLFRK